MNTTKLTINIQKFYNDPHETEYVPFQSPSAVEEVKKQLADRYHEDLPGLVTITFNNELIFGEYGHTEDLFITLHCLVSAAITKIQDSPEKIILLDNGIDVSLERQGKDAQFIFESNTITYGHEIKKSPLIPVELLVGEIIKVSKEFIKFCQDANLRINEDSSYYAILEKLKTAEKE
ncbi:hypothetical protein FC756_25770 [Lysinibacillus mangiferihumi]|uniref:Uncharacterized protein n=1 Tax=Lysinibacillus mangiferihumi TaxID=1130819 RepID=A0A4U2XYR7_9BACI|nr:hypothetical protein [Lysinibacillus mangiferihumi]TKI53096.1 hypothetical protein FC756_25770 [Lysinibacillus mangiferihumi]